jgi:hypothetical protein
VAVYRPPEVGSVACTVEWLQSYGSAVKHQGGGGRYRPPVARILSGHGFSLSAVSFQLLGGA